MLAVSGAVAAVLAARPLSGNLFAQQGTRGVSPQPLPSHDEPTNPNAPIGLNGSDIPVTGEGHQLPLATWAEVKTEAQKILDIATDFKWQVDRANLNSTMPLLLLQEAHSIEKLAKHIQDHMKR